MYHIRCRALVVHILRYNYLAPFRNICDLYKSLKGVFLNATRPGDALRYAVGLDVVGPGKKE